MGATPLTARCSRCKKYRRWDGSENRSHLGLEPTGRWKVVNTTSKVLNVLSVEVVHNGLQAVHLGKDVICGHVFWSTHPRLVKLLFPKAKPAGNAETSASCIPEGGLFTVSGEWVPYPGAGKLPRRRTHAAKPIEHEDENRMNCTPACRACAREAKASREGECP